MFVLMTTKQAAEQLLKDSGTTKERPLSKKDVEPLFPCGKVFRITRTSEKGKFNIYNVPNDEYDEIRLNDTMIVDHTLHNYRISINKLCKSIMDEDIVFNRYEHLEKIIDLI